MKNLKTVTLLAESLAVLVTLGFTTGDAAAQGAPAAASAAEVGRHLSNPTSDVWALFTEFDYTKNNGTLTGGGDSKTVGFSMVFQPISPIPPSAIGDELPSAPCKSRPTSRRSARRT